MSKQHCRTLQVERFFRQCRVLLRQQCRTKFRSFDNVETNKLNMFNLFRHCRKKTKFRSTLLPKPATLLPKTATMSKQHLTFSKGRNFTIESFDIVVVCGNKVKCWFDKERCFDNVACCFDIVAGVDGALRFFVSVEFIGRFAGTARGVAYCYRCRT